MTDGNDMELSAYESKRLQRMEENQRVLQSLNVPTIPRRPSRSQYTKTTVKLEPSRRSSRQIKRREIAKKQELESITKQQQEAAKELARNEELELKKKQIALQKEMEVQARKLKQKQEKQVKAEKKRKRQKETRQLKQKRQRDLEAVQLRQQRLVERQEELKRQQLERQQQQELPPEKVAERNAEIQRFIQAELDKQAKIAQEKKQQQMKILETVKVQRSRDEMTKETGTTEVEYEVAL